MSVSTTENSQHSSSQQTTKDSSATNTIRKIDASSTVRWLSKGIQDFKSSNINSLLYGLLFVIAGGIAIWFMRFNPAYVMILVTGFYLVGPPVAAGLYDISRKIENNEEPSFFTCTFNIRSEHSEFACIDTDFRCINAHMDRNCIFLVSVFFGEGSGITTLLNGDNVIPFSSVLLIGGIFLALLASAIALTFLPLLNNRRLAPLQC